MTNAMRIKGLRAYPLAGALLFAALTAGAPTFSSAALFVSVNIAPPALPVYTQPVAPGPGYMWTPGYWAYGPAGYYWVPGVWVLIPFVGALWTPGYWGWGDGSYVWHAGYWGPHVGFYGGVNYGFGYGGEGYQGGRWDNGRFAYNTAVNNINRTTIRDTYNAPVARNTNTSRVSFNGGAGGLTAQPTAEDRVAERDQHRAATPAQVQHEQVAARSGGGQVRSGNRPATLESAARRQPASTTHAASSNAPTNAGGSNRVATTRHARSIPSHAVSAKAPAVSDHNLAVRETQKSPNVASHTAQVPNQRLAASHASNAGPRPAGAAPHAQSEAHAASRSEGGHNGGGEHKEGH